jgi:hypothetical protein
MLLKCVNIFSILLDNSKKTIKIVEYRIHYKILGDFIIKISFSHIKNYILTQFFFILDVKFNT